MFSFYIYSPDCDKLITDRKTIVTSPEWPSKYPSNMNCTYRFVGDPSKKITFRVKVFKLQGKEPRCKHDKLEVSTQFPTNLT